MKLEQKREKNRVKQRNLRRELRSGFVLRLILNAPLCLRDYVAIHCGLPNLL